MSKSNKSHARTQNGKTCPLYGLLDQTTEVLAEVLCEMEQHPERYTLALYKKTKELFDRMMPVFTSMQKGGPVCR